VKIIEAI